MLEQTNVEVNREQILTEQLEQLAIENKMEQLAVENKMLKEQLEKLSREEDGASSLIFDKFKSAIKFLEDIDLQRDFLTNTKKMVGFPATKKQTFSSRRRKIEFSINFILGGHAHPLAIQTP